MRRRATILTTTITIALMVASGVALAAEIRCPNSIGNRCIGTNEADTMTGTNQDDDMVGLGGPEKMEARGAADKLFGGGGSDKTSDDPANDPPENGGPGDDLLTAEGGDHTTSSGSGGIGVQTASPLAGRARGWGQMSSASPCSPIHWT